MSGSQAPVRFGRLFWSLYGRLFWDRQESPWKSDRVERCAALLLARRRGSGERVLDAGCGTGEFSLALAAAGFSVTGVDYARGMLERARVKASELAERPEPAGQGVEFRQADANQRLPFEDRSFDHAISISVLQVLADPAFSLGELFRVTRPGGTLVLLHVPGTAQSGSLRRSIRDRFARSGVRGPLGKLSLAAKVAGERYGGVRSWSSAQLREMVSEAGFRAVELDQGPPVWLVATREAEGR